MTDETSTQPAEVITATAQEVAPAASAVPAVPATPVSYKDDDLVYVDPKNRTVVGLVQFSNAGKPKPLAMQETVEEETDEKGARRRTRRQRYYPWGTYRSMKRVYKIEGKIIVEDHRLTLDEVMEKALKEPYWN